MRMYGQLCIGNRETEHGAASSDLETAQVRYVLDAHLPLVHMHTVGPTSLSQNDNKSILYEYKLRHRNQNCTYSTYVVIFSDPDAQQVNPSRN